LVAVSAIEHIFTISTAYVKYSGIGWEGIEKLGNMRPDTKTTLGKRLGVNIIKEGRHGGWLGELILSDKHFSIFLYMKNKYMGRGLYATIS
jgi:hypothetical protein